MIGPAGAVLVAAGASRRMGFDKLWAPLGPKLVLGYALETLALTPLLERVALVVAENRLEDAGRLAARFGSRVVVCAGGEERRDSVEAGLRALERIEWVVVHDAARPFVSAELVARGLEAAVATGAAVAAVPTKDTIKRVVAGVVVETPPRDELWNVQTPQVFRASRLRAALERADRDVTDEATLIERLGGEVRVFGGSDRNWKITTPADLDLARALVAQGTDMPARPLVAS